jgi:transcriptional regulator with XRE-family HTH domain
MSRFGRLLRQSRRASAFGIEELAEEVGVSRSYLCDVERGGRKPPSASVILAAAWLLSEKPDPDSSARLALEFLEAALESRPTITLPGLTTKPHLRRLAAHLQLTAHLITEEQAALITAMLPSAKEAVSWPDGK